MAVPGRKCEPVDDEVVTIRQNKPQPKGGWGFTASGYAQEAAFAAWTTRFELQKPDAAVRARLCPCLGAADLRKHRGYCRQARGSIPAAPDVKMMIRACTAICCDPGHRSG